MVQKNHSGFVTTNRANPLAQKIVANDIALGVDANLVFYTADNCEFLHDLTTTTTHSLFEGHS